MFNPAILYWVSTKTRIAVLGAGPAGLTAAYELAKNQHLTVDVYEASDQVGGMAKTIELWGQKVDLGPHRFYSTDVRVNKLWLEVMGKDYSIVDRITRIYYRRTFFYYPIQLFDVLKKIGIFESLFCLLSFVWSRLKSSPSDASFESWVTARFGKRLFEIFFKQYSEKLWGISCKDLDSDFAMQRIKKLSLWETMKSAIGIANQHRTLVDEFAYPNQGSGQLYDRMAESIRSSGNTIHLSAPVTGVWMEGTSLKGIVLENGTRIPYDHVISSIPLTKLVLGISECPTSVQVAAKSLSFRNTIIVYLHVRSDNLFPDQWLYLQDALVQAGRVTNFRNWVPSLYGPSPHTILALEYWCNKDDERWTSPDAEIIQLAHKDMKEIKLATTALIEDAFVVRIPNCYPIYRKGYRNHLKVIECFLSGIPNLQAIGRYGAFKYNNQDHSILMGLLAADNIVNGAGHNLWESNTGSEYFENSTISESGLQIVKD